MNDNVADHREAAFREGFDLATESHKEALDILRERNALLEASLPELRQRAADVETLTDILAALVAAVRDQDDVLDPASDLVRALRDAESWLRPR